MLGSGLAISGSVSCEGNVGLEGTGTLTLTGAFYTGGTTISGGTLQLGDGVANNGSVVGNIVNNAALAFADPSSQSYSGAISGSGNLEADGPAHADPHRG